ncbi:MAG: hypothetical protein V4490_06095 [Pseudomonadota bacterium]
MKKNKPGREKSEVEILTNKLASEIVKLHSEIRKLSNTVTDFENHIKAHLVQSKPDRDTVHQALKELTHKINKSLSLSIQPISKDDMLLLDEDSIDAARANIGLELARGIQTYKEETLKSIVIELCQSISKSLEQKDAVAHGALPTIQTKTLLPVHLSQTAPSFQDTPEKNLNQCTITPAREIKLGVPNFSKQILGGFTTNAREINLTKLPQGTSGQRTYSNPRQKQ